MMYTKMLDSLTKYVSRDDLRPAMQNVRFDGERLLVTNGHYIISLPVKYVDGVAPGVISADALRLAEKGARAGSLVVLNDVEMFQLGKAKAVMHFVPTGASMHGRRDEAVGVYMPRPEAHFPYVENVFRDYADVPCVAEYGLSSSYAPSVTRTILDSAHQSVRVRYCCNPDGTKPYVLYTRNDGTPVPALTSSYAPFVLMMPARIV